MNATAVLDNNMTAVNPGGSTQGASSFVVLATYPPTHCGLATFAKALCSGLEEVGVSEIGVVRVVDELVSDSQTRVVAQLVAGSQRSRDDALQVINGYDYLLVQHEFGIFGGADGVEVLDLLKYVEIPIIVTLHTVPLMPTTGQRHVLEAIAEIAQNLVTMTVVAKERLLDGYSVEAGKVVTVPHGAAVPNALPTTPVGKTRLLTWGLLGFGKGIEHVIDALALLPDLVNDIEYVVAGQTHPKIVLKEGERYRDMLKRRASVVGVSSMVSFDDSYRPLPSLLRLVERSTCVVLPYDSPDQITSGVLVDAVAAGRPVIATAFPHAVELLSRGAGLVVPHQDPSALALAIRQVATNNSLVSSMVNATVPLAAEHKWSAVAARYIDVATSASASWSVAL
jgi:glycosyltransferase involved in cell wall biosynthesis